MPAKKTATKSNAKRASAPRNASSGSLSTEERAAMKDRARELKASKNREEAERACREAIAKMKEPDRAMAKRIHALVTAADRELAPRTWYGMPAYAKDDKVVCFFQDAQKFKSRYATFGFSDEADLDTGGMWPVAFALKELTSAEEAKITALVKKAVH